VAQAIRSQATDSEYLESTGPVLTEGPKKQNPGPFAQMARDQDGVSGLLSFTFGAATPAARGLLGGSTQQADRSVHRYVR
jgi:hypothetical protein